MSAELIDFKTLALRRAGPVLHVTLNRPELRNAMSLTMVRELRAVLAQSEMSAETRVLVLRGAGGHFCAGADLSDMASARAKLQDNPQALVETNAAFGELCVAYSQTPLAVVAAVEGSCMGGGFGLACVADVTLAADTAVFRLPETGLGLVPAQIGPFLVERLGYAEAKRLAVTGGKLGAAEALQLRLAHGVCATAELDAAVERVLADILQCAPGAVAMTKALIAKARFRSPADLVQEAAQVFSAAALGAEGVEGTTAFIQKRKPRWAPT
jgi:isohexenylglutaconyl-CoA hydratase